MENLNIHIRVEDSDGNLIVQARDLKSWEMVEMQLGKLERYAEAKQKEALQEDSDHDCHADYGEGGCEHWSHKKVEVN